MEPSQPACRQRLGQASRARPQCRRPAHGPDDLPARGAHVLRPIRRNPRVPAHEATESQEGEQYAREQDRGRGLVLEPQASDAPNAARSERPEEAPEEHGRHPTAVPRAVSAFPGFALAFHRRGPAADETGLRALASALAVPGRGPLRGLRRGPLAVVAAQHERVGLAADASVVVVGDLRLDRGEEPCGRSGQDAATWLLGLWRERGPEALDVVAGRFALLVFDAREGVLVAARDATGSRRLHVHATDGLVVAATSARAVAAHAAVPCHINAARVARVLVPVLEWSDPRETLWAGILRHEAGTRTTYGARHATAVRLPRPWAANPADEGHLDEALRQAVADALPATGTAAVLLSGGLDSSLVLGLAREVRAARPGLRLWAVGGSAPAGAHCVESRNQLASVRHGPLDGCVLASPLDLAAPMEHAEHLLEGLDDPFAAGVGSRSFGMAAAAAAAARVLLTGVEGHLPFDALPSGLARALEAGRLGAVLAWASRRATEHGISRWRVLREDALRPLLARHLRGRGAPGLLRTAQAMLAESDFALGRHAGLDLPSQVVEAIRHRVWDERGRWVAEAQRLGERIAGPTMPVAAERYAGLGDAFDVALDHPLMDPRALAVARVLSAARRRGGGEAKSVLAKVASGRVPPGVLRGRRPPEPPWGAGLLMRLSSWLPDALAEVRGPLLPWLETGAVDDLLARRATWASRDRERAWALLALGRCLVRVTAPRPRIPTPSVVLRPVPTP